MSQVLDVNESRWRAFVAAARLAPADDTPLLVWADWLDEVYAESQLPVLIRNMVEVARVEPKNGISNFGWIHPGTVRAKHFLLYDRAWVAFQRTWRNWPPFEGNAPHLMRQCILHRGFPLRVVCTQDYWFKNADRITAMGPVGEVILVDEPDYTTQEGMSVCFVSPRDNRLYFRLPTNPENPHYTTTISMLEWRMMDQASRDRVSANYCCDLYRLAWRGKVGHFSVNEQRDRENITVNPADVPAWPTSLT